MKCKQLISFVGKDKVEVNLGDAVTVPVADWTNMGTA